MYAMDPLPVILPGSPDSSPLTPDYYKRAVYRAAPRYFSVDVLPPQKIGSAYSYGMRVYPIRTDGASIKSGMSHSYEIWRRWEDCLWFQDTLESQYGILSRQKRARLQSGKGVKKNGMYIHDRASSWESLPPGPDPKSVSKDVHEYLPRLTKRGTLFRSSTATVEQRHRELTALFAALFASDVPALLAELREERIIRDFFGYWRRDHDLLLKRKPPGKKPRSSMSSASSAFSMYFTSSNVSLSAYPDVPSSPGSNSAEFTPRSSQSQPSTSSSGDSETSSLSLSDLDLPRAPPASAPARSTFPDRPTLPAKVVTVPPPSTSSVPIVSAPVPASGASSSGVSSSSYSSPTAGPSRQRAMSQGSKPAARSFNLTEDFPLFLSSSTRDLVPTTRTTPRAVGGLEVLSEDSELSTPPSYPVPTQRPRTLSRADPTYRNGRVFEAPTEPMPTEEPEPELDLSSTEGDPPLSSSPPPSTPSPSEYEIDFPFIASSPHMSSQSNSSALLHHHMSKASIASVDSADAVIPRAGRGRPRSHSQPLPQLEEKEDQPQINGNGGMVEGEHDSWIELGDDFMDTYFGGESSLRSGEDEEVDDDQRSIYTQSSASNHRDGGLAVSPFPDVPSTPLSPLPPTPMGSRAISLTPELFGGSGSSPLQFHLPLRSPQHDFPMSATQGSFPDAPLTPGPTSASPTRARSNPSMSVSSSSASPSPRDSVSFALMPPSPQDGFGLQPSLSRHSHSHLQQQQQQQQQQKQPQADDTLVVKAALDDAIVVFRAPRFLSLASARARIREKFASTEGRPLADGFLLAYVPAVAGGTGAGGLMKRDRHASVMSAASADWARQVLVGCEEDWRVAVGTCGQKLVLRVTEP